MQIAWAEFKFISPATQLGIQVRRNLMICKFACNRCGCGIRPHLLQFFSHVSRQPVKDVAMDMVWSSSRHASNMCPALIRQLGGVGGLHIFEVQVRLKVDGLNDLGEDLTRGGAACEEVLVLQRRHVPDQAVPHVRRKASPRIMGPGKPFPLCGSTGDHLSRDIELDVNDITLTGVRPQVGRHRFHAQAIEILCLLGTALHDDIYNAVQGKTNNKANNTDARLRFQTLNTYEESRVDTGQKFRDHM